MPSHRVIPVADPSQVGDARRWAVRLAEQTALSETARGRVGIVATELATNLLRHGGGGEIFVARSATGQPAFLEVLAVDQGPGMADVTRCLTDGYSTGGTPGNGLGAVRRLSAEFDLFSQPGLGTVVFSRVAEPPRARATPAFQWGGVSVPCPGEEVCGDAWHANLTDDGVEVVVADGLGHGPNAAEAANAAVRTFDATRGRGPEAILKEAHGALSSTRGAAVAVASVQRASRRLKYAGIGNIAGYLISAGSSRGLMSHNGIVGAAVRRVQSLDYEWPGDPAMLVMHSDGIRSRWSLDGYHGLAARHPSVIAALVCRDFRRGKDDATVVVLRASPTA